MTSATALPRRGVTRRGAPLALLAAAAVAVALFSPATPARAAPAPVFQPGTLTSDFPTPVSWRFTFRSDTAPTRVELLTRLGDDPTTFVSVIAQSRLTQASDGSWVVAGSDTAAVTPNTLYHARLRVTTADGVFEGPEATVLVSDARFAWQVLESPRLRLHWYQGGADFAARALKAGDDGVVHAESFLGVHLGAKVDIFIYADQAAFRDAIGRGSPENAAGVPFASIETFFALIPPEQIDSSFVGTVVPHELTHLVLEAAIGPGVDMPLWLNEGMAVYLSTGDTDADRSRVRDAIAGGTLVPLDGLTGDFPSNDLGARSLDAYSEAVSAVDFMVRTYGQAGVAKLVAAFGSQGTDAAFRSAFGTDTQGFQAAWLHSLGVSAPQPFGPAPAPTGPLPSDWLGTPPAAGLLPAERATPSASPLPATPPVQGSGASTVELAILGVAGALALIAVIGATAARRKRAP